MKILNLLLVMLMLPLVLVVGGCGAGFQLSSLEISPQVGLAGETVTVLATLSYSGDVRGDYEAELSVDGVVEQRQTFSAEPQSSRTISFHLTMEEPGSYVVQVGKLKTPFTVLEAADLGVSPTEVEVNQPVTVTAKLQNVIEDEVPYRCRLLCQGEEVEARDITMAGNSMEEVTFTLSPASSGTHQVELLGLSGSFRVLRPAEFEFTDFNLEPNPVGVGGVTTVTVRIENVGEVEGSYDLNLVVDGLAEETRPVPLPAGVVKTETFTVSRDSPGSYSLQLGGQQAELMVIQTERLANGTLLVDELPCGMCQLKVSNQGPYDALVVLASREEPGVPLLALYVRADDFYRVKSIGDGYYIFYFALGEDWDNNAKKFLNLAGCLRFADELHFKETGEALTIWTVTLGGEVGESSSCWTVPEDEFPPLE